MIIDLEKTNYSVIDNRLIRGKGAGRYKIFAGDVGNSTMEGMSPYCSLAMPHAIKELSRLEFEELALRGEGHPEVYEVNGVPIRINNRVSREGDYAVRFGSERYTSQYIGRIYAILLYEAFKNDEDAIYVMANHPPRDKDFRPDIIKSIEGTHLITHMGNSKRMTVIEVGCYDEPVGNITHAFLDDDGATIRGAYLKNGVWLMVDVGGWTTDLTVCNNGIPDLTYGNNDSLRFGMLDVLGEFETLVRRVNKDVFKHIQFHDPIAWRLAFQTGVYDAKEYGEIPCASEREQIGIEAAKKIHNGIKLSKGGLGRFDGILVGGGGGARSALGDFIGSMVQRIDFRFVEDKDSEMHFSAVRGAAKRATALANRDRLILRWRA